MIRVAAGVILRGRDVLACQRAPGTRHEGKWEFPGGKVEPGETLPAALRRELLEELDIDADIGEVLWQTRCRYPGEEPVDLTFLRVPGFRGEIRNRVFAAIRWVPAAALDAIDFLDGDRELVAYLSRSEIAGT